MKKLLLSLASVAFLMPVANADTLYELTFDYNKNQKKISSYIDTWTVKCDDNTWTMVAFNNNNNGGGEQNLGTDKSPQTPWEFVRCGRKNNASTASITTNFTSQDKVNEIVIAGSLNVANSGETNLMTTAKVEVYNVDPSLEENKGAKALETISIPADDFKGAKGKELNITVAVPEAAPNLYYRIVFDMAVGKANGFLQINKVTYNGESSGPVLLDPEVKFPEAEYTVLYNKDNIEFESPVATTLSTSPLVYSSSDPAVATVDAATGAVTVLAIGNTTITASVESDGTYKAGSASYLLIVKDANIIYESAMGVDFKFENVEGQTYPWSHDATFGLKGSAFINKAVVACEGIAYSPVIDLNKMENIKLDFMTAFNQYKINNNLIDIADFSGYAFVVVKEEGATEWTVLEDAVTAPEQFSWNYYPNDQISLEAYKDKKIRFGFKYVSTDDCAGTWEVKGITLKANLGSGIADVEAADNATPVYYNLQGVRVANPENGLYIMVKGNKSQKVMIRK